MPRVKLGSRRKITIPEKTVKRLGLKTGEELELMDNGKVITLDGVVDAMYIAQIENLAQTQSRPVDRHVQSRDRPILVNLVTADRW